MDDAAKELVEEQAYSWLEMHKKSALTYLVLSSLENKSRWSKDILDWVGAKTGWSITERGFYRVLRRMQKQGIIIYRTQPAERTGAERKVYALTPEGKALLELMRNELAYLDKN